MSVDTIVRNGTVVTAEQDPRRQDILIRDGRVVGLVADSGGVEAAEVIDGSGLHVLPGGVETHGHIGMYGPSEQEWYTETGAAASGGITTVINFFYHPVPCLQSWPAELEIAQRRSLVDFTFHFGILSQRHLEEMDACVKELGITSFKLPGHWKGFERNRIGSEARIDDGLLYQTLRKAARYENVRVGVHCQNVEVSFPPFAPADEPHFLKAEAGGLSGLRYWERVNPPFAEAMDAIKLLYLAEQTGASVYLVHTSWSGTVEVLAERFDLAKLRAFSETCPHYLALTMDSPCGILAKVNPPIRDQQNQDGMWRGLMAGFPTFVGTDHCACSKEMKKYDTGDVMQACAGFAGMATTLPVLVTHGVRKRGVSLRRLAEVYSTGAARVFGLYPRKGTIAVGSDADLVLVDLSEERTISANWIKGVSDFNVFEGEVMHGFARRTLVRGKTVYHQGEIVAPGGSGQYLPRRP